MFVLSTYCYAFCTFRRTITLHLCSQLRAMQGQLWTTSLTFSPCPLCFRFTSYYKKKRNKKKLSFYISCAPISFFSFNHGYTGWHQRKQWIISFVCALDLSVVEGKMAFIVDCTFSPETCNKVIGLKNQEQNCNKITLLIIFLFISWACLSLQKWTQVKMLFC